MILDPALPRPAPRRPGSLAVRLAAAAVLACAPAAAAQQDPARHPGVLKLEPSWAGPAPVWASGARPAATERVRRLYDAVRAAPAVATPVGYDVTLRGGVGYPDERGPLRPVVSGFLFFYGTDDAGHVVRDGEGPTFGIEANRPLTCAFRDLSDPFVELPDGRQVFGEPVQVGTDHGYPVYDHPESGSCTLVSAISRPLWLPVTQRQVLNVLLGRFRAMRDEARRQLAAHPGADAARALLQPLEDQVRGMEQEIASLAPSELDGPAYLSSSGERASRLSSHPAPDAVALVTPNPAYLDASAPLDRVQTLSVSVQMSPGYRFYSEQRAAAFRAIHDGMDWTALQALVR
jgi:hypothetical protein